MESEPNEHGVLIGGTKIILVRKKDCKAVLKIAEYKGLWRYGLDYYCGGTRTGASGSCFAPSINKQKGYPSKDACIKAAKKDMRRIIRYHIEKTEGYYPAVAKMARDALSFVPVQEQLSLF